MGFLRSRIWGSGGHLGTSLEVNLRVILEVNLRVILGHIWTLSGPYLRNLIETSRIAFIWPWVGS